MAAAKKPTEEVTETETVDTPEVKTETAATEPAPEVKTGTTITAPVKGFTGSVAGVEFVKGKATDVTDVAALAYFGRHGYKVEK